MLEISNNDYKNTIDLLTAKLGIKEPMINRAEMYGDDHPQRKCTGGGTTGFVKATYVGICACGGAAYCWLGCG
jgi:hypothetical protein